MDSSQPTGSAPSAVPVTVTVPNPEEIAQTRADALEAQLLEITHQLLAANDTIAGMNAALITAQATVNELSQTDVGVAFARVDDLENRLEAMLHELRWTINSNTAVLEQMRLTPTWRIGTLVARPLAMVTRRRR
ncbi:MAG: hypothetical protein H7248_10630 [Microbacteriaceae bacterium]|nr:hypothetical protein [Microbacteriaceae bacterium]